MAVSAAEWQERIAEMAAEPGFEPLLDPATPVLVWSPEGRPVWTSAAGAAFLDQQPAVGPEAGRRLRELAGGVAPPRGFRLERLRWTALDAPVTVACRLLSTEDGAALLTAVIDKPSRRRDERPAGMAAATAGDVEPSEVPAPLSEPTRRRLVRFTWQADREGRFTAVSSGLAQAVGARGAAVVGKTWSELVGRVVEDTQGGIARAWADGVAWSRGPALWRDLDAERLVPVELSGAPSAGRDGFRGFGLAYPDEAIPVPPGAFRDAPGPGTRPDPGKEAESSPSATAGDSLTSAMDAAAALTGTTGETVFSMLRAWFGPHFAPPLPVAAPEQAREPEPPPAGTHSSAGGPALTGSERGALDEIARALRGGSGLAVSTPDDAPLVERPSAEIVPWPAAPRRTAEASRLLDQLPAGILVARDGLPVFANRFLLNTLGFDDLPDVVARGSLHEVLSLELTTDGPLAVAVPTASGELRTFDGRTALIPWGELEARLTLLAPMNPSSAAETAALRLELKARDRRQQELEVALDLAADGSLTLDESARLLSLSPSAERLFGVAANEVVGDSLTVLIEPRDHRTALACLDALRSGRGEGVQHCEIRGRTREGAVLPLSMRAGRMAAVKGEASFSVALRDVTRARLLEDDLRSARAVAEQASANRADFLARISHEIRTPLTAITGFAELMLEERFGSLGVERYKDYVRDILDSGVHVISLVNDLLDLAKATSGRSELAPAGVDLNAVVQQCVALSGPLASRERTILRTSFAPLLPSAWADERSVRQIVINILSNAIRFTGPGGQVIVSTAVGGPTELVLSVRDTGEGMSEDEVEAALTPFRQVPKSRRGDGTGLGLPLSKALAEANGGLFTITSAKEHGTLVEVRLPVHQPPLQAVAAE